jgi:hypothetical protein
MKRKITISLVLIILITLPIFAPMKYSWNPSEGSTQVGFSLQNLSDYLIQFQIYNESAGGYHRHVLEIEPNGQYDINLNTNVPTRLKIYSCPETTPNMCSELNLPTATITETSFPLGKTIYISWDGKELLPQNEGPVPYATKAGYYLTDNVKNTDYRLTGTKSINKAYPKEIGRNPWEVFPGAQQYANSLINRGNGLRVAETYTDITLSQCVLGLSGTPSDREINRAWALAGDQWNPDDHPDEPNFARAVMRIINRSRANLLNPIIRTDNNP